MLQLRSQVLQAVQSVRDLPLLLQGVSGGALGLLTQANLDLAVQALKGAPLGLVRVGVCKPRNIDGLNSQESLARSDCGSLSVDGTAVSGELHTDTPVSQSVLYNEPVPL